MHLIILTVISLCFSLTYSAPENVRERRTSHWHKEEPIFIETVETIQPQPVQIVYVEKGHSGGGTGFEHVQFGSSKFGGAPIIQVVEKGAGAHGLVKGHQQQAPVIVIEKELPAPIIISDDKPLRLKHVSEPYIVENFNTQYIIDHYQGAKIEKFQRLPTIIDHYLPADVTEIGDGGHVTIQLDCAGNPVGQVRSGGSSFGGGSAFQGSSQGGLLIVEKEDGGSHHKEAHDAEITKVVHEKTTIIVEDEENEGSNYESHEHQHHSH